MIAVRHAGIVVEDLEAMLAFYVDGLGLAVAARADESGAFVEGLLGLPGVRVTTVKLTGDDGPTLVELLCYRHPAPPPRRPLATNTPGPTHVAFTVSGLDSLHARLAAAGIAFNAQPRLSPDGRAKVAYCRDPEGNFVELVEMMP
ncbi:MAG TPA: VOC family protein [Candidatus Omnitrophota bacterium]|nr:VOC family protein [Candidatus Omnitrophota bacterium]